MKKTKIVATIGPASEKKETLKKMIAGGMNVARLNFSHNVYKHHEMLIRRVREVANELGRPVTILQDLQGPRIRVGQVPDNGIVVKEGEKVILYHTDKAVGKNSKKIPIHYARLASDIKAGERILIEDGLIELKVEKVSGREVYCVVEIGGVIKTHKGINFPDSHLRIDAITEKDWADLEFGINHDVDFVALSFVSSARDILRLRREILRLEKKHKKIKRNAKKPQTKIVAKIERRDAIKNLDKILKAADAAMVARGDLGIELPFEDVPLLQKEIIHNCNVLGKPVIVATQMLDSMIRNPLPTRAEVSDVANAILDGTDAIMLSGESATGKYPLQAIKAMKRIAQEVEPTEFKIQQELEPKLKRIKTATDFTAYNAQDTAEKLKVKAIICLTDDGVVTRSISRYKTKIPVLAFTENERLRHQLNLSWGVEAYQIKFSRQYQQTAARALALVKMEKRIKKGDTVIVCCGGTSKRFGKDNFLEVFKVSS